MPGSYALLTLYSSLIHELGGGCNQNKLQFRGRPGIAIQETRTTASTFKVEKQLQKKQKFHRVNTGFGTGVKQRGLEHNNLTRSSAGFVTPICCNLSFSQNRQNNSSAELLVGL